MMVDIYQGDPLLFLGADGSYIEWVNGQPVMDQWLENEIQLSAFTPAWFGNYFVDTSDEEFNSALEEVMKGTITVENLNAARDAVEKSLAYLVAAGRVQSISAAVYNPFGNRLKLDITVVRNDNLSIAMSFITNRLQWVRV